MPVNISNYPYTGTTLDKGKTRTGLSTQIVIYVNGEPVGAVQSFGLTQQRSTKSITEVGTDGIIEIVPSSATTVTLSITRVVFDGLSITEAFSRSFVNLSAQRIPFDIVVIDRFFGDSKEEHVVTTFHNCWFTNIGKTYNSSDYVIQENCSVAVEYMSTERNGDSVSASQGLNGGREIPTRDVDASGAEAAADTGRTRGSLDFPGIIQAAY
jgi:hypothetical protein